MVAFDNSVFCLALHPSARPPEGVDRAKDRIEFLVQRLKEDRETILLPTPALAEFLVFAGLAAPEYLRTIRETSAFRVEPFDEKAAIELADIELTARRSGNKRGSAAESGWQKVKFDRQIVAISKAAGATALYSDDPHIVAHGKDCGVAVITTADLPLPAAVQIPLIGPDAESNSLAAAAAPPRDSE